MKSFIITVLIVFLFVFNLGAVHSYGEPVGEADEEVQANVDPVLDNILSGLANEDYYKYAKDFDVSLKESISRERFTQIREGILKWVGNYLYREYLGFLNKQSVTIVFWKGVFEKTQEDILIKMAVTEQDGRLLVTGLWFE